MPTAASAFWRVRFARWRRAAPVAEDGYTLLVPVPGDLPVFTDLALTVCRQQTPTSRRRTLVIPDRRSPAVRAAVEREATTWPGGGLELLDLPAVDQAVLPRLGDPGRNHGAQLVAGVTAATTERVVLHDADLFMLDADVHESLYLRAEESGLDVLGISPAWDPWYADRGRTLAATWEQTTRTTWLRAVPPHRHLGHEDLVDGEPHVFDTTFWAQWRSDPDTIRVDPDLSADVVHFNYVISTYRRFRQATGGFHDGSFRLLLIRLMVDLFGEDGGAPDGLPSLGRLADGLADGDAPVGYVETDGAVYRDFRARMQRVLQASWVDPERAGAALDLLTPFDRRFGTQGPGGPDVEGSS